MLQLHISGMTCGGCARAVTKAIQTIDPSAQVEADPPKRTANVATSADQARLLAALSEAGYPAEVRQSA